jgi:hypothetical protein
LDLITTQWVVPLGAHRWSFELATITGRAVVVKNDFSVEIFKPGHDVLPCLLD